MEPLTQSVMETVLKQLEDLFEHSSKQWMMN